MKVQENLKSNFTFLLIIFFCFLCPVLSMGQKSDVPLDAADIDSSAAEAPKALREIMKALEAEKKQNRAVELEIDGLIVDETVTKMGRTFYEVFYNNWEAPPNAKDWTLTITEKPMIGMGTRVMVDINDQRVVETPLQPRYDVLESLAQQAVAIAYDYLLNYEQIQKDLSGEDLSGSGIY